MTWPTFWWLVLFVLCTGAVPLGWAVVGRVYHRWAVRDPVRRSEARARRRKVPGSGIRRHIGFLIVVSLQFGLTFPLGIFGPLQVRLLEVVLGLIASLLYPLCIGVVLVTAWSVLNLWREKRFFDRLEREEHLICPDCHYSLEGHAAGGHCPECGYTFTPESLVEDWTDVRKLAGHCPLRSRRR